MISYLNRSRGICYNWVKYFFSFLNVIHVHRSAIKTKFIWIHFIRLSLVFSQFSKEWHLYTLVDVYNLQIFVQYSEIIKLYLNFVVFKSLSSLCVFEIFLTKININRLCSRSFVIDGFEAQKNPYKFCSVG
jgi:hypothetical protein